MFILTSESFYTSTHDSTCRQNFAKSVRAGACVCPLPKLKDECQRWQKGFRAHQASLSEGFAGVPFAVAFAGSPVMSLDGSFLAKMVEVVHENGREKIMLIRNTVQDALAAVEGESFNVKGADLDSLKQLADRELAEAAFNDAVSWAQSVGDTFLEKQLCYFYNLFAAAKTIAIADLVVRSDFAADVDNRRRTGGRHICTASFLGSCDRPHMPGMAGPPLPQAPPPPRPIPVKFAPGPGPAPAPGPAQNCLAHDPSPGGGCAHVSISHRMINDKQVSALKGVRAKRHALSDNSGIVLFPAVLQDPLHFKGLHGILAPDIMRSAVDDNSARIADEIRGAPEVSKAAQRYSNVALRRDLAPVRRTLFNSLPHLLGFGLVWSALGRRGPNSANICRSLTKFGRSSPNLDQTWLKAEVCRTLTKLR